MRLCTRERSIGGGRDVRNIFRMMLPRKTYLALLVLAAGGVAGGSILARRRVPEPVQPIEFSHRLHAGDNQISCTYCHTAVTRSMSAGVPSVSTCYECHRLVKLKNPEINSVLEHWENVTARGFILNSFFIIHV